MATVDVLDWNKKKVGTAELSADVFEQPVKKAVLHSIVKWQLAKRRAGTHKVKTKGEVSGGGKKPFKQKGTGNARQGSSRSPLMPGGGVSLGPSPRNYDYQIPKKMKQVGLKSALSHLQKEGKLYVVDQMTFDGKTKSLATALKGFGLEKAVLIDSAANEMSSRSARNLANVRYYGTEGLNVYDLLKYDAALITKDSIQSIEKRCGKAGQ